MFQLCNIFNFYLQLLFCQFLIKIILKIEIIPTSSIFSVIKSIKNDDRMGRLRTNY